MTVRKILTFSFYFLVNGVLFACGSDPSGGGGSNGTTGATTCTPGSEGCPCRADGTCDTLAGEAMTCVSDVCTPSTSNGTTSNGTTATSNGTTSTSNGTTATSNGTTATSNGTTGGFEGVGVIVGAESARSCEITLVDPQQVVGQITFADSVRGKFMRRGERIAMSFFPNEDMPIPPGAVSVDVRTGGDVQSFSILTSRCFDGSGAVIDDVALTIQR